MLPSPLSNASVSAIVRHAPKVAFTAWLLTTLLVLAVASLPAADSFASLLGGTLQTRIRLAATAFALVTASWLFLALFGHKPLGPGIKMAVKLTTHVGIVLLSLIVGAPGDLLLPIGWPLRTRRKPPSTEAGEAGPERIDELSNKRPVAF